MPSAEKPKPTKTADEVARFWKLVCRYCSSFPASETGARGGKKQERRWMRARGGKRRLKWLDVLRTLQVEHLHAQLALERRRVRVRDAVVRARLHEVPGPPAH